MDSNISGHSSNQATPETDKAYEDSPSSAEAQQQREMNAYSLKYFFFRFKSEIVFAVLTLILTLGLYYQGAYATRIGITEIWKNGYTANNRDLVTNFIESYKIWEKEDPVAAAISVDILADFNKVKDGSAIYQNRNLLALLTGDLEDKETPPKKSELIKAAKEYRNAIIECLNTMEAVKAVIQARPWWFNIFGIKPDSLDARYEGVIDEQTNGLNPFIEIYRFYHNKRQTPPWIILTEEESNKSLLILAAIVVLISMYRLLYKRKMINNNIRT